MVGIPNRVLRGIPTIALFASCFLEVTIAVVYTELTVNSQFTRNNPIANTCAIVDRLISASKVRESTCAVTAPSPRS